jgi:hypothetical protein
MERGNIGKAFGEMIDNAKPDKRETGKMTLDKQIKNQESNIKEVLECTDDKEFVRKCLNVIIAKSYIAGFNEGIR